MEVVLWGGVSHSDVLVPQAELDRRFWIYHVTCQHVPELAGMRWNRIDQHLIRYYQNILQTTRVLLGRYIEHFPLHVNSRSENKNTRYSHIISYHTFSTYTLSSLSYVTVMRPFRIFYFVIIYYYYSSYYFYLTRLTAPVFDWPIPILHASHWQSSRTNQKTEPTWIIMILS